MDYLEIDQSNYILLFMDMLVWTLTFCLYVNFILKILMVLITKPFLLIHPIKMTIHLLLNGLKAAVDFWCQKT